MKNIAYFIVTFFFFTLQNTFAQSTKYRETLAYLKSEGYTVKTEQNASLKQGETAGHTNTFYKGTSYIFVAMSDDPDVSDVDIFLKETDGTEYSKDTDDKPIAIVQFEPSFDRQMRVVIKNYKSSTPSYASTVRFVIAYK